MVIVSIRTYACTYFIIKFSNLKPVNEIKKRKNEKLFKPLKCEILFFLKLRKSKKK